MTDLDPPSAADVEAVLREIVGDISEDVEPAEVTRDTRLVDLGMESISLVYMISELQTHYGLGDRLFPKMRAEGILLVNLTVGDVIDMIVEVAGQNAGAGS